MEASNSLISVFITIILSLLVVAKSDNTVFNVLDYGAVGDGRTDDTNAFSKAWQATCSSSSSSAIMQVPSDKTFLIQAIRFDGPCNSKSVTMEINGNLVAPNDPSDWECEKSSCEQWIYFHRVDGLTVHGHGVIDARGKKWWNIEAFEISNSDNVNLRGGLKFKDSPRMHVVLNGLNSIFVSNISIEAPEKSPNTDGIHVSGCINAFIDHARIGTGDDCISIVDGSSYVTVSNVICGPGHGISIGSLGKNGANDKVEYVSVSDVVFIGATNGARIKTWQGGRGYARHIVFERILLHATINPIIIDQFYCDHQHCVNSNSAVQITNVTYRQILGTSKKKKPAVKFLCSESFPCRDIVVEDIHIAGKDEKDAKYECSNVYGRARGEKVPQISCLN
ncbi:hypothetical protein BUALT_Bualt07G0058500 [Buddleja alternifolia]|uniref:Polygalacturonase n=1 Tax=Buddleja alternifolia TaxID=168488 RepID=A0AAV6X9R3_9LAMI|nr:hypothetical protein BUALT_Bualt07G0058500 [Buddleja alternifolia]